MSGDLGERDALLGEPVKRELVEHAVGAVGLDQPLDRQQRRGQRGDPQSAGADPRQQSRVGPDRERAPAPRPAGRRRSAARPRRSKPRRMSRAISAPIMRRAPARASRRAVAGARRRAPRRRLRDAARSVAASRSAPSASRALSGSSSSHSGAPDAATRASVARFGCPDESSRTGTSARWPRPSASIAASTAPPQKAKRAPQRQLAIEREIVVGERQRRRVRRVPAPARSSPAARRIRLDLPLPFGPVTCSASPGPSARSRSSNSSRPPRRSATPSKRSSARHSALVLERVHVVVGEAEMMADLVDDDVVTSCSRLNARRLPLGEDRPPVERDPLRQHARLADALPVERNALVEPAQLHRVRQAERGARSPRSATSSTRSTMSPRLSREGRRQPVERAPGDRLDVGGGRHSAGRRSAGVMPMD